jgi:hypothetical protein
MPAVFQEMETLKALVPALKGRGSVSQEGDKVLRYTF